MQKLLSVILVFVLSLQISAAQAENLIDSSDWYRIFFHEENDDGIKFVENTDTTKFAQWYNTLSQEDKNQVLADSVVVCAPTFTEIALQNGGDIKTPVYKVNVGIDLGNKTYVFTSGSRAGVLKSAGVKNSGLSVGRYNTNDMFTDINYGVASASFVSLLSQGILSCPTADYDISAQFDNKAGHLAKTKKMTEILLKYGASANMFNEYGESALSHALLYLSPRENENKKAEMKQIFKMLIEKTPPEGWAPEVSTGAVIYAFSSGEKEVVDLVSAHKFNVSFKTKAAQEALLLASYRNDAANHQLLKDLLQNGVDVNYQNADGQTALFMAVRENNVEAVKFLLAHGAQADIIDNAGNNAWQQCEDKVYNENFAEVCNLHPLGQQVWQTGNKSRQQERKKAKEQGLELL